MEAVIKFTVPPTAVDASGNPHPEAGKVYDVPFTYESFADLDGANKVIADRKWDLVKMVNQTLKGNARAAAYQAEAAKYAASSATPDDIAERLVRDFVRLGLSQEDARAQVESMRANIASK